MIFSLPKNYKNLVKVKEPELESEWRLTVQHFRKGFSTYNDLPEGFAMAEVIEGAICQNSIATLQCAVGSQSKHKQLCFVDKDVTRHLKLEEIIVLDHHLSPRKPSPFRGDTLAVYDSYL